MTQELIANTPLSAENVGLLKAGDVLWEHERECDPFQYSHTEGGIIYGNDNWTAYPIERVFFAFRPALSPPTEGEPAGMSEDERRRWLAGRDDWQEDQWQDHCGKAGCEECSGEIPMTRRLTPTPAPIDWSVVGPKLVEAMRYAVNSIEAMRPTFSQVKDEGHAYHDQVLDEAQAALAAAQPEGK